MNKGNKMSEKLKTFVEHGEIIIINQNGKLYMAVNDGDEYALSQVHDVSLTMKKESIIKLFNLDLEVEDEA